MGDRRPVGVFDSGAGGLTVLRAIRERLPLERTIYVGDHLHFPYGPRYQHEVKAFALVDSAETTAAMVERRLDHARLRAESGDGQADNELLVTALPERFDEVT